MIAVATVRKCRTVAKTETVPLRRYYREGCQPFRTPTSRRVLVIGVPRCHRIDRRGAHARGVLRANVRSGRSPWSPGALPIECASEGRFLAHRIDRCCAHTQGYLARGNPRPRKYPPKYPQCGRSKNPAFSRVCEKYPQYPQYPRDVGDACLMRAFPCAQRCESQGASGDDLSPTARRAVFSRF